MADNDKTSDDRYVLNTVYPDAGAIFSAVLKPIAEIKTTAVVVLDTNVLLVPFALSPKKLEEIAVTYRDLKTQGRLVVPGQVAREFARLRASKLGELYQQLNDQKSKLPSSGIGKRPLLEGLPEFVALLAKEQQVLTSAKEYGEELSKVAEKVRTWTWNDPVSELYRATFTNDVVVDSPIDRPTLDDELKYRVANAIPPGYKDRSKADGGIGDLVIWDTVLRIGEKRKLDVIFVTGEEKSDWWHRGGGQQLYPRFELVDEFRRRSGGRSFHIVSFADLLELYGATKQLVSEVRKSEIEVRTSERVAKRVEDKPFFALVGNSVSSNGLDLQLRNEGAPVNCLHFESTSSACRIRSWYPRSLPKGELLRATVDLATPNPSEECVFAMIVRDRSDAERLFQIILDLGLSPPGFDVIEIL